MNYSAGFLLPKISSTRDVELYINSENSRIKALHPDRDIQVLFGRLVNGKQGFIAISADGKPLPQDLD